MFFESIHRVDAEQLPTQRRTSSKSPIRCVRPLCILLRQQAQHFYEQIQQCPRQPGAGVGLAALKF
jgi:hypothetical protein